MDIQELVFSWILCVRTPKTFRLFLCKLCFQLLIIVYSKLVPCPIKTGCLSLIIW